LVIAISVTKKALSVLKKVALGGETNYDGWKEIKEVWYEALGEPIPEEDDLGGTGSYKSLLHNNKKDAKNVLKWIEENEDKVSITSSQKKGVQV